MSTRMSRRHALAMLTASLLPGLPGVGSLLGGVGAMWASALLAGCGKRPPSFDNLDITDNADFNTAFSLPDTHGRLRTIADEKGKVVVLFFGYTQCPDVCPTSMAELADARKRLGADAQRLQVIFVTVDPQRDTPAVLDQYVAAFDPSFIALRPQNDAAVAAIAKAFHLYVAKVPVAASGAAPGSAASVAAGAAAYTVDHTAASFVFDPTGKLRLYARDGQGVDRWVHDVKLLLNEHA